MTFRVVSFFLCVVLLFLFFAYTVMLSRIFVLKIPTEFHSFFVLFLSSHLCFLLLFCSSTFTPHALSVCSKRTPYTRVLLISSRIHTMDANLLLYKLVLLSSPSLVFPACTFYPFVSFVFPVCDSRNFLSFKFLCFFLKALGFTNKTKPRGRCLCDSLS